MNYQVEEMTLSRLIAFLGASWNTDTSQGAESHWPYTPCVCTEIWKDSFVKLHSELLPLCCSVLFYCSFHPLCFWCVLSGFFKTTRNKLSLLPVFVAFGVEMNTWIAEPWSTGGTLPPQHKGEQCLALPMLLWLKMGGVGLHPALCVPCVFSYPCVRVWLFRDLASLKWRALAFAGEVLWQWQVWVRDFWFPNSLLWAMTSVLPEAFPWEETQLSCEPELCSWSSREALALPREALPAAWWVRAPSHCCHLPCPRCATALAKPGSPVTIQSWNRLKPSL